MESHATGVLATDAVMNVIRGENLHCVYRENLAGGGSRTGSRVALNQAHRLAGNGTTHTYNHGLLKREDSPWYPTMRLFRQQRAGDWGAAFGRMVRQLEEGLE